MDIEIKTKNCPDCGRTMVIRGGMFWCWHCDDDTRTVPTCPDCKSTLSHYVGTNDECIENWSCVCGQCWREREGDCEGGEHYPGEYPDWLPGMDDDNT